MKRKPVSYARFYALLARLAGDRDIAKETLVERFTEGRTSSLREMHAEEYDAMCRTLEAEIEHPGLTFTEYESELRRLRSAVLRRMQRLGVDTTDWTAVDLFCRDKRIAGKRFAAISGRELRELLPKLEAIARKYKDGTKAHKTIGMQKNNFRRLTSYRILFGKIRYRVEKQYNIETKFVADEKIHTSRVRCIRTR